MIHPKYNLIFSTSLFIIPTVYGYYNKKYTLSTMSLISTLHRPKRKMRQIS